MGSRWRINEIAGSRLGAGRASLVAGPRLPVALGLRSAAVVGTVRGSKHKGGTTWDEDFTMGSHPVTNLHIRRGTPIMDGWQSAFIVGVL